jgi:predicted TIM-barrel fold metal-dependent hydrolase
MIVDAHTHIWPRWPYEPEVPDSASRGSAENLLFEMDTAGVDVALVVNARIPRAEDNNDYGAGMSAKHPTRLLQVADIDSRFGPDYHRPGATCRLAELVARLHPAGISHYLAPENDGWLRHADGVDFFATAMREGLVVTLAAPPVWMDDIRALARRFPELPILINHLGVVGLHPGGVEEALAIVADDSDIPNLYVKVSGFYYGHERPWDYPYLDRLPIVETFARRWGPARMVWASDWPSLLPHHSYRQALHLLREHAPFLSDAELAAIQGDTLAGILRSRGRLD